MNSNRGKKPRTICIIPVLGQRLQEITRELLNSEQDNPTAILGYPDDLKLKSSMTLFSLIDESEENIFKKVLVKFYKDETDVQTVQILKQLNEK